MPPTAETETHAEAAQAAEAAPIKVDTGLVNLADEATEAAPVVNTEPISIVATAGHGLVKEAATFEDTEPVVPDKWWTLQPAQQVKIAREMLGNQPLALTEGQTEEDAAYAALSRYIKPERAPTPQEEIIALSEQNPELYAKLHAEATNANDQIDFMAKIMEARRAPPPPNPDPAPIAPRILEQTNAEIAAGRAMVERSEAAQVRRHPPVPEKWDGKNTEVFRPDNFTEYKSGFKSQSQTPDKATALPPKG